MPELNNTFVKGRMNKDLDDRLVPPGEYRDALNIEVSTSEDSDVGTVQNIKGNNNISDDILSTVGQENIFDSQGVKFIYVAPNTPYHPSGYGTPYIDSNVEATNVNSFKILPTSQALQAASANNYRLIKKENLLTVDKYYTLTFNYSLDLTEYPQNHTWTYKVGLIGLDTEITQEVVKTGDVVSNDAPTQGSISKTFYCTDTHVGIYVTRNFIGSITNVKVIESTALESDTNNAITVGSKHDTITDTIYNFVYKASDFKLNTFTNSEGEIQSRMLGIQSDAIIQHKPNSFEESSVNKVVLTDVYRVRVAPRIAYGQKLPMVAKNGSFITNSITGLPYIVDQDGNKIVQGIRTGMSIKFLHPNGVDLWEGLDVRVNNVSYDEESKSGKVEITEVPITSIYNQNAIDLNFILEFNSPRVLKFLPGTVEQEANLNSDQTSTPLKTYINAINIVDNFIYYTDGRNEPKKINIKQGLECTKNIFEHTYFKELNTGLDYPSKYFLEEKYINVIKAKPTY
jgi:hypothetical protein